MTNNRTLRGHVAVMLLCCAHSWTHFAVVRLLVAEQVQENAQILAESKWSREHENWASVQLKRYSQSANSKRAAWYVLFEDCARFCSCRFAL